MVIVHAEDVDVQVVNIQVMDNGVTVRFRCGFSKAALGQESFELDLPVEAPSGTDHAVSAACDLLVANREGYRIA